MFATLFHLCIALWTAHSAPLLDHPVPAVVSPWRLPPRDDHVRRNPRAYAPRPESAITKSWDGRVHTDCVDSNMVALTFDDGVNEGTERVLHFLRHHHIKATFFILGSQVNRATLRRMVKEGHVVASHSWDHPSFPQLGEWDMRWQLQSTEEAIYEACRRRPRLFRPPYGDVDWRVSSLVNQEGYEIVNWNIDSNDWHGDPWAAQSAITGGLGGGWKSNNYDIIIGGGGDKKRGRRRGGYIILQHDAYFQDFVGEATVKAARKRGLRFVTLDECLGVAAYKNQREVDREMNTVRTSSSSTTGTIRKTTSTTSKTATTKSNTTNGTKIMYEDISIFTLTTTPSSSSSTATPIMETTPTNTDTTTQTPSVVRIPTPTPLATLVIAIPLVTPALPTYDPPTCTAQPVRRIV